MMQKSLMGTVESTQVNSNFSVRDKETDCLRRVLNVMVAGQGKELVHVNFYVLRKFITMG
jgi:hypothetical protein